MANHSATGKKAKRGAELAQRARAAILNALDVVEKDGKLISEILAEEFKNNPIKFMELASKFTPKDINAEVSHVIEAKELTDDELADIATGRSAGTSRQESSAQEPDQLH